MILDTGIDADHPYLGGRVVRQDCFSAGGGNQTLCDGGTNVQHGGTAADALTAQCISGATNLCDHGSHVAGIAAGQDPAALGYNGVAPEASIIAIQVFTRFNNDADCGGNPGDAPCVASYASDQLSALNYVNTTLRTMFDNIISVNMSLGGGQFWAACDGDSRKAAIDNLRSNGIATVISSGNEDWTNSLGAPGCISTAVTVGNTFPGGCGPVDTVTDNMHPLVDLLGSGRCVDSSVPDDAYANFSGTSMAAPQVTGAFAMLKAIDPSQSITQIETLLEDTGELVTDMRPPNPAGDDAGHTKPRLQLNAAAADLTEADLRVFKDCKPDDPILVDEDAVCTITVENLGCEVGDDIIIPFDDADQECAAMDVVVDDAYLTDGDFTFGAVTISAGTCDTPVGPTGGAGSVHCDLGGMHPGDVVIITIPITADAPGNINDHVTVSSDTPDPNPENNWDEDSVTAYEGADLRITKFGKPEGKVRTGDVLAYTVIVDNPGPSTATTVAIKDILQSNGTFDLIDITSDRDAECVGLPGPPIIGITASSWPPPPVPPTGVLPPTGWGSIQERLELYCTLDADLEVLVADGPPNLGRWILTLRVRAYESQDMNNVADVVADTFDPDKDNNHAEVLHEITDVANLEVTKVARGRVMQQGGAVVWLDDAVTAGLYMEYTVTVTNNGPARAENVVVEDTLPPGIVVTGAYPSKGTCTTGEPGLNPLICELGTLNDGASEVIIINADVPPSVPCDTLENDVLVYSDMFDADMSDNRDYNITEVSAWADLWVDKDQEPEIVLGGKEIYYKILVGNEGPSDSGWVTVHDILPPELYNVSWQCTALGDASCPNGESSEWGDGDIIQTVQLAVDWKLMFEVWATRHPVPDWEFTNYVWAMTSGMKGTGCVQDPDEDNNFDDVTNEPYMHFLPLIYNIRFDVALPDLIVKSMWVEPWEVAVTVINTGPEEVKNPFYVEVYVGSASGPTGVNQHWRDLGSEGLLWFVHGDALPLGPGETLMVRITDEVGDEYYLAEETSSQVFWPIGPGTQIWAQVDSRVGRYGLVYEIHEWEDQYYNNIKGPYTSQR